MSYEPKDVRIDLPRLGDESAALAESERAQLTEYKAQNARLESVIAGLKQQVKALERDQNESLEHIRNVCRQRDEATGRAEKAERARDEAKEMRGAALASFDQTAEIHDLRTELEKVTRERDEFRMRLDASQEALTKVVRERNDLRVRLADLERRRPVLVPLAAVGQIEAGREERVFTVTDLVDSEGKVIVEAGEFITVERNAARNQVKICDESGGGTIGYVVATQRVLRLPLPEPPKVTQ